MPIITLPNDLKKNVQFKFNFYEKVEDKIIDQYPIFY